MALQFGSEPRQAFKEIMRLVSITQTVPFLMIRCQLGRSRRFRCNCFGLLPTGSASAAVALAATSSLVHHQSVHHHRHHHHHNHHHHHHHHHRHRRHRRHRHHRHPSPPHHHHHHHHGLWTMDLRGLPHRLLGLLLRMKEPSHLFRGARAGVDGTTVRI